MKKETRASADRIWYYDCLRIIATFAVMILHLSAQNWHSSEVASAAWKSFNFYDSISRWGVPVFVMISGALFLDAKPDIAKIYRKNILRIVSAFLFWSTAYAAVNMYDTHCSVKDTVFRIIKGHYHLWFLFMIVGLYMIVPFLSKIAESREMMKYFLILAILFTFVFPQINVLLSWKLEEIGSLATTVLGKFKFHFTLGYTGYFVGGYYLSKMDLKKSRRWMIYLLGICGFAATIILSLVISLEKNKPVSTFYDNLTVNVMLESIAVFVFAKQHFGKMKPGKKMRKIIVMLSKYSFGAYLVHIMVIEQMKRSLGLHTLSFHPFISVPVLGVVVFVISITISGIIHHIPFLNKYIV